MFLKKCMKEVLTYLFFFSYTKFLCTSFCRLGRCSVKKQKLWIRVNTHIVSVLVGTFWQRQRQRPILWCFSRTSIWCSPPQKKRHWLTGWLTNRPTDQLTNRPTDQLTNRPTDQQTHREQEIGSIGITRLSCFRKIKFSSIKEPGAGDWFCFSLGLYFTVLVLTSAWCIMKRIHQNLVSPLRML